MEISGSKALLTGATGGIGHAIARALHARGAQLTLTGRRSDVLEPLAEEVGGRALAVDLSVPAEVDRLIADAGEVDVLIANAALPAAGRLESFTMEEIDRALAVNLRAPIALAHALAPAMVARRRGHLLFMSSLAGKVATPGASLYHATKFGLRGLAAGLRCDLHGSGVGVSAIFPGFIREAGMFAHTGVKLPPGIGTRSPEDVAKATVAAIERNHGERDVAAITQRGGVWFSTLSPDLAARVARTMGAGEIAEQIDVGQRDRRA